MASELTELKKACKELNEILPEKHRVELEDVELEELKMNFMVAMEYLDDHKKVGNVSDEVIDLYGVFAREADGEQVNENEEPVVEKKGRGRKSTKTDEKGSEMKAETVEKPAKGRGRKPAKEVAPEPEKPKGRGRKAKAEEVVAAEPEKKVRGRKAKTETPPAEEPVVEKKGRGRKAKEVAETPPEKSARGRKAKEATPEPEKTKGRSKGKVAAEPEKPARGRKSEKERVKDEFGFSVGSKNHEFVEAISKEPLKMSEVKERFGVSFYDAFKALGKNGAKTSEGHLYIKGSKAEAKALKLEERFAKDAAKASGKSSSKRSTK